MLRIGSKVKILGNNNKGIILDINQNSANVLINNHISAYDLCDLEEEDLLLTNRLLKKYCPKEPHLKV
jgi:hypothetical protein